MIDLSFQQPFMTLGKIRWLDPCGMIANVGWKAAALGGGNDTAERVAVLFSLLTVAS